MKDEFTGNGTEDELTPAENRTPNSPDERVVNADGGSRIATERLERVEAALELLLDHLETSTRGTEILEAEHSRSLLSSIALGFSAIALIALWSIDLARDDIDIDLIRFTIGMSFLLLASVVDLFSSSLLRRAVHQSVLEKEPSSLSSWQGQWYRFFSPGYWATIKRETPKFYHYQSVRSLAFAIYLLAGAFLIWAVFTL